jgi:hypothetical protein
MKDLDAPLPSGWTRQREPLAGIEIALQMVAF